MNARSNDAPQSEDPCSSRIQGQASQNGSRAIYAAEDPIPTSVDPDNAEQLRLQNLGLLAGDLSHKLNNLLNSVVGYSTLSLMEDGLTSELANNLEIIEQTAKEAADLNSRIFSLAHPNGETGEELVNLGEILHHVIDLLNRFPKRKTVVNYQIPPDLPDVVANPDSLQQVLLALLLTTRGTRTQQTLITLQAEEVGRGEKFEGSVRISLSRNRTPLVNGTRDSESNDDDGPKGDPRILAVDTIIKKMGGSLSISTDPEGTLHLEILIPTSYQEEEKGVPNTEAAKEGITVLVADDEKSVRDLITQFLEGEGYRILTAENGSEAFQLYTENKSEIELTLLDMTMPGMNGYETMKAIQKIDSEARFILISGYPEDAVSYSRFCSAFLSKPFLLSELKNAVTEALQKGQAEMVR
jgi:CheY-like chemotaxis protein